MKTAIYPGTFDPITNGHLDVIKRALKIFDKLIIAVSNSPKKSFFSITERLDLVKQSTASLNVQVDSFDTLLVVYAKKTGCNIIVRGLRAISDFDHEFQLSSINRKLNPNLETIFIMTSENFSFLSSSAVKELAQLHGDLSLLVPEIVEKRLLEKYKRLSSINNR